MKMMKNIFMIFDPSTSMYFSLNWISMLLIFFFIPFKYWLFNSRYLMIWMMMINYIFKEYKILINYSYSNLIIIISIFNLILLNNFMGLFPYIFTSSSHMSFSLSFSFSLWLSIMIYSLLNYFNNLCSHLTPKGTPFMLIPFMILIESISLIIRPLTLSVRLTANMIAGHLLMSLLASPAQYLNFMSLSILIFIQLMLYILEISVSIIQSYVFSILILLYSSET